MLPVAGHPALEYTIGWLRQHGVREILINLHHHPEAVRQHFGDGSDHGVRIEYSLEEQILGTAGGAKRRADFFDGPFVVIYGDVLTDLDLADLVRRHRTAATGVHLTMCLYRVTIRSRIRLIVVVAFDGTRRGPL